jgi:hypothetical protein
MPQFLFATIRRNDLIAQTNFRRTHVFGFRVRQSNYSPSLGGVLRPRGIMVERPRLEVTVDPRKVGTNESSVFTIRVRRFVDATDPM